MKAILYLNTLSEKGFNLLDLFSTGLTFIDEDYPIVSLTKSSVLKRMSEKTEREIFEFGKISTWTEFKQRIDDINEEYEIDEYILFDDINIYHNDEKSFDTVLNHYTKSLDKDNYAIGLKTKLFHYILHLMEFGYPITHIRFDNGKFDYTKIQNELMFSSTYNLFEDSQKIVEYTHLYKKKNKVFKKEIDLTCGYAISSADKLRYFIPYYLEDITNHLPVNIQYEFYGSNPSEWKDYIHCAEFLEKFKCNDFLPRKEYLTKLSQSKYTIIFPTYPDFTFPLFKVIEALGHKCLPFFIQCSMKEFSKTYPEIFNIFREFKFITNQYSIGQVISETNYDEVINLIIQSDEYQKLISQAYYKNFMELLK